MGGGEGPVKSRVLTKKNFKRGRTVLDVIIRWTNMSVGAVLCVGGRWGLSAYSEAVLHGSWVITRFGRFSLCFCLIHDVSPLCCVWLLPN